MALAPALWVASIEVVPNTYVKNIFGGRSPVMSQAGAFWWRRAKKTSFMTPLLIFRCCPLVGLVGEARKTRTLSSKWKRSTTTGKATIVGVRRRRGGGDDR
jgi:hypothetical protein